MLVTGSIPSLIQGISEQPDTLRLPSQASVSVNTLTSLTKGLMKRPPSEFIRTIRYGLDRDNSVYHFVIRDTGEKYVIKVENQSVWAFDLAGNGIPVFTNGYAAYLTCDDPRNDLRLMTVADTTFIVNRGIKVQMTADTAPTPVPQAVVWVRQGNYSTKYRITFNGNLASYTTLDSTADGAAASIQTTNIAANLDTALDALPNTTTRRVENHLWFRAGDSSAFTCEVGDDLGGNGLSLVYNSVQRFSDLPDVAAHGMVICVKGNVEEQSDDYWVKFVAANPAAASGVSNGLWEECPKPGVLTTLDPATMPHRLVRKQDDALGTVTGRPYLPYLSLERCPWTDRLCGDDTTNPKPSFVGSYIDDIFLWRNRLGFLSRSNIVMSASGDLYRLWRETSMTVSDADPIDVTVSHNHAINLAFAVPQDGDLVIFGDTAQVVVTAADILSPKTVKATVVTEYQVDTNVRPQSAGSAIFFATPTNRGKFNHVWEFYTSSTTGQRHADLVTGHVPTLLAGTIRTMAVSTSENVLVVLPYDEKVLYLYRWHFNGQERVLSAWTKWEFTWGGRLMGCGFDGGDLYILIEGLDEGYPVHLEKINLRYEGEADGLLLDRRAVPSRSYNGVLNQTTYLLDYAPGNGGIAPPGSFRAYNADTGAELAIAYISGHKFVVDGEGPMNVICGERYLMSHRVGPFYLRTQSPLGGIQAVQEGRLQLRSCTIHHSLTRAYSVLVEPAGKAASTYIFEDTSPNTGSFRVPILARNTSVTITLQNFSRFPCFITGLEWTGFFVSQSKRV